MMVEDILAGFSVDLLVICGHVKSIWIQWNIDYGAFQAKVFSPLIMLIITYTPESNPM